MRKRNEKTNSQINLFYVWFVVSLIHSCTCHQLFSWTLHNNSFQFGIQWEKSFFFFWKYSFPSETLLISRNLHHLCNFFFFSVLRKKNWKILNEWNFIFSSNVKKPNQFSIINHSSVADHFSATINYNVFLCPIQCFNVDLCASISSIRECMNYDSDDDSQHISKLIKFTLLMWFKLIYGF